ncbi:translation initiation factor eIF-2B subunit alpha [Rozella allomycis CSF55]|uniref:Translation initiation factor eIF2B subunit alpha n=1 Tax=Rozella allomycis (strain CSF55) TaxID=988480 RepID=A0A075B4C0_ROZAC|nr:Initiation factor 2B-related domain-containing protein [Rozella allomycis CSF55]RKP20154.1 translation initiation factor eIF-2B subunit alpha [Rozella allomycis CSF55]|eukprot:EPZ36205.1 Initiation factor 2B-related domain-containing protein [Rozella allomycis CSF55]
MAEVIKHFENLLQTDQDLSVPVAAIKALSELIPTSKANTMAEFIQEIEKSVESLKRHFNDAVSVSAGCELFLRFVTRTATDFIEFEKCKKRLYERGSKFEQKASMCRQKIAQSALNFIRDGTNILIHSYSRVVTLVLLKAAAANKRFTVYVTEARPGCSGISSAEILRKAGIPVKVILDSAVGYYMESIDMVLVGAEGFVENGGLINQIGTYLISVMAKAANKPFYAVAESFKFVRLFPLSQSELSTGTPTSLSYRTFSNQMMNDPIIKKEDLASPLLDYTPPAYITLLFTDIGVLTPSGVSDELIKLYY